MEIMEKVGEKLSQAGKEMQTRKEVSDMNKLIEEELAKQRQLYVQLGEIYYEKIDENAPDKCRTLAEEIAKSDEALENYRRRLQQLQDKRICEYCQAPLEADVFFCPRCGKEAPREVITEQKNYCSCGTEIKEDDLFCAGCGRHLKEA